MVSSLNSPKIDPRNFDAILHDFKKRIPYYTKKWYGDSDEDPGLILTKAFVVLLENITARLNRVPEKNFIDFLNQIGTKLIPNDAARIPITISLAKKIAHDVIVRKGTLLAAEDEKTKEVVPFETLSDVLITRSKLSQIFSLDNEFNEIYCHTEDYNSNKPFSLFARTGLDKQKHVLYLGHSDLLNLKKIGLIRIGFHVKSDKEKKTLDSILNSDCVRWSLQSYNDVGEPMNIELERKKLDTGAFPNTLIVVLGLKNKSLKIQEIPETRIDDYSSRWIVGKLDKKHEKYFDAFDLPEINKIDISISDSSLDADLLYHNNLLLPVTDFYPYGRKPVTNDMFYFASRDAFSKKGSKVTITVNTKEQESKDEKGNLFSVYYSIVNDNHPKADKTNISDADLSLEYWNGTVWQYLKFKTDRFPSKIPESDGSPQPRQTINITIPDDMTPVEINGQNNFWLRSRIVSGDFGTEKFIIDNTKDPWEYTPNPYSITPPHIHNIKIKYNENNTNWSPPQHCITYNNLEFEKHFDNTKLNPLKIFKNIDDTVPTIFFGLDTKIIGGPLSVFFSIKPDSDFRYNDYKVTFYYSSHGNWEKFSVKDNTLNLTQSGFIKFYFPDDFSLLKKFGKQLFWIKVTLEKLIVTLPIDKKIEEIDKKIEEIDKKKSELPYNLNLNLSTENSKNNTDHKKSELIDKKTDLEKQHKYLSLIRTRLKNKLPKNTQITGIHLNSVESRNSSTKKVFLSGTDTQNLELYLEESPIYDSKINIWIKEGAMNTNEEFAAVPSNEKIEEKIADIVTSRWILWKEVDDFEFSQYNDRHFISDKAAKQIKFGDGVHGKIPPKGNNNIKIQYVCGGGEKGNIEPNKINSIITKVPFVDKINNPYPAAGGRNTESVSAALSHGTNIIKHRNRAVCTDDVEALVLDHFPSVAKIKCLDATNDKGKKEGGWITVVLITDSTEKKPVPSIPILNAIEKYLEKLTSIVISKNHINVRGPDFVKLSVIADVYPATIDDAAILEEIIQDVFLKFFNPIYGGLHGTGFDFGEMICFSDLYALLEKIPEVDHIDNLLIKLEFENESDQDNKIIRLKDDDVLPNLPQHALIYCDDNSISIKFDEVIQN